MTLDDLREMNGLVARINRLAEMYLKMRNTATYLPYHALWKEAKDVYNLEMPSYPPPWDGPLEVA
jgi:hypothetical protein